MLKFTLSFILRECLVVGRRRSYINKAARGKISNWVITINSLLSNLTRATAISFSFLALYLIQLWSKVWVRRHLNIRLRAPMHMCVSVSRRGSGTAELWTVSFLLRLVNIKDSRRQLKRLLLKASRSYIRIVSWGQGDPVSLDTPECRDWNFTLLRVASTCAFLKSKYRIYTSVKNLIIFYLMI